MNPQRFTRMTRVVGIPVLGVGVGLALPACSPGASSAAAGAVSSATAAARSTASGPIAASAPAVTATPTNSLPAATPRATLVPMQTATGGEFLSPSGNISCEVDYQRAGLTQVYCQTATPARSVTMAAAGSYTTCTGEHCLGNPGDGSPTLAYGTATGVGPVRCESAVTGITCVANGRGFQISASGITPASA
jgi:hypothetical protein